MLGAYTSHNENFIHLWALRDPGARRKYKLLNSDSWLLTSLPKLGFQVHLVSFLGLTFFQNLSKYKKIRQSGNKTV
jgi:hypothetical protein